ncbi:Conserved oligomeric Golgi complex subunit [Friedmanniomyces endolithicus]|nr:Conserved oligomeric Golgi complex subunit [Friedmanniomyces endolithicus]KAK0829862.1 Conserved oligomeric Golgi complex subunit [Friedmanniomyces endolithicus]
MATSYVDLAALTSDHFSATAYANALVLRTNNPTDPPPLDLSTPLSRVLFDVQEIDTNIDSLTTQNALPIITATSERSDASQRVLEEVEGQVNALTESYKRLEREVSERYEAAEEVRVAAKRMVRTLRLGRSVQRVMQMGRQIEGQMEGMQRGEHRVMVPASHTLIGLRQLFGAAGYSEETEGLGKVHVVTTLRNEVMAPAERALLARAKQVVREFSMSSLLASGSAGQAGQTYTQSEETKSRTSSALQTLYLLSLTMPSTTRKDFSPTLLISALQSYLSTALTSSLASLTRALATLPQLDRTLLEISARCQNIVALETLLSSIKLPEHPLLLPTHPTPPNSSATPTNLLHPLLHHLDTSSLPSYFWRSLASQLTSRVNEILSRGGVSARTLRTNKDRVRDMIRECVDRGSRLPGSGSSEEGGKVGGWEREAAVMMGSVIGPLGR